MPISLTCSCGARLEIDDKFAGQTIPCPDCHKPLRAELPPPPATRTSGLAILSLVLALVGAFTVVGTLAAIVCGAIAYRQLTRRREPVGGMRLAQAGMILGVAFTVLAVGAFALRVPWGIDGFARKFYWIEKLDFSGSLTVPAKRLRYDDTFTIDRPSMAWGVVKATANLKEGDHLMLVNPVADAQILVLSDQFKIGEEADDNAGLRSRALDCFRSSAFVRMIGRLPDNPSESYKERGVDDDQGEFYLDIPLSGIPRTFWFRLQKQGQRYVKVLVCGARSHGFKELQPAFRNTNIKQE
jgi:hypothetical protein